MKQLSKGFTLVELLVVIAILGVLMSVLVPTVTGYITSSHMTAMSIQGAELVKAVSAAKLQSNNDLWPHNTEEDGLQPTETDKMVGKSYGTSTEYFKELFDIEHQTTKQWKPRIDGDHLKKVWADGDGVPKQAQPGTLEKANVAWSVASGIYDGCQGGIPFLVTRNLDTAQLLTQDTNLSDKKTTTPSLTKNNGQPFGEKGCVVVTVAGSGYVCEGDSATLDKIYRDVQMLSIRDGVTLKYLEP